MSLSSADLTSMRSAFDDLFTSTAKIESLTVASDSAGGQTETWTVTTAAAPCSYVVPGGILAESMARISAISNYVLTFSHDQTIAVGNRVTIGSSVFIINFVSDRSSNLALRCYANKVA